MIRTCDHGHASLASANWSCPWCKVKRLEDEVAALQAANIRLQQALAADPLDQSMANEKLLEQVAEARAEVEVLRAEIDEIHATGGTSFTRLHKATQENEELLESINLAARTLRGDGADDQGDAYDKAQRILDAALAAKENRP